MGVRTGGVEGCALDAGGADAAVGACSGFGYGIYREKMCEAAAAAPAAASPVESGGALGFGGSEYSKYGFREGLTMMAA